MRRRALIREKQSSRLALLFLLLGSLSFSCSGKQETEYESVADTKRNNIVLISIDSLRADHLTCYGYERPTSPSIDRLAAEGILFERASSHAPWTLPSHVSLLTSLYPRSHQTSALDRSLPEAATTLASELKRAGYRTHAIVSGPFMRTSFGMARGFDGYDEDLALGGHAASHEAITSDQIHRRLTRFLDQGSRPFFLFLHYWDVHYDYLPPAPYDEMFDPGYQGDLSPNGIMKNQRISREMSPRDLQHLVALYDGEIRWVDHHIGLLLDELKERGLAENTIIALTADHGDEFFEHGEKGHSHSLYEELLHVPLILRVPGESPRRVHDRVQLIDVMPTLLELAGAPDPGRLQGRSLVPLLRGQPLPPVATYSETTRATKLKTTRAGWSSAQAIYRDQYKLIHYPDGRYPDELYDISRDPGESRSLSNNQAETRLSLLLQEWRESTGEGIPEFTAGPDPETLEQLKQLGYTDE